MAKTIKKDTIYAKGLEIGIYTEDFQNEYISMTDIRALVVQQLTV